MIINDSVAVGLPTQQNALSHSGQQATLTLPSRLTHAEHRQRGRTRFGFGSNPRYFKCPVMEYEDDSPQKLLLCPCKHD